jgi:uncharacterized protein (TIGR02598 family)
MRKPLQQEPAGGFSLIECVLSLGVVAFAFMALLGMLPIGLEQFRVSKQETVTTEILKFIDTQIQQTQFSDLANTPSSGGLEDASFAFSEEGLPVTLDSDKRVYLAVTSVTIGVPVPSPGPTILSGLATVDIEILRNPPGVPIANAQNIAREVIYAGDRGQ